MAHYSKETRDNARKAYVHDQLSLMAVSVQVGVPYNTVSRWKSEAKKDGDDWDKLRTARAMAGGSIEDMASQILTEFLVQFQSTMELIKHGETEIDAVTRVSLLTSLSDSFNKAIAANRKLMPETSKLATALEVLEMFAAFIKDNKPDALMVFMELLEPFGEFLEKELK